MIPLVGEDEARKFRGNTDSGEEIDSVVCEVRDRM